jgi:hypothetical protein
MKKVLMLLAASAIGLGTMNAWAVDTRVQPAVSCKPGAWSSGTPNVDWDGRYYNTSTSADLWLVCPIVRDNTSNTPFQITATILDLNGVAGHDGGCWFTAVDAISGNTSWGAFSSYSNPLSAQYQTFPVATYWTQAYSPIQSEVLVCFVPPDAGTGHSALLQYMVAE